MINFGVRVRGDVLCSVRVDFSSCVLRNVMYSVESHLWNQGFQRRWHSVKISAESHLENPQGIPMSVLRSALKSLKEGS
jgi:hypothetical protein